MKIMQVGAVVWMATIMAIIASFCSCNNPANGPDQPQPLSAKYGYIYNADGSPCANAKVVMVPSNYVPSMKRSVPMIEVTTDTNGCYSLDTLTPGTYNVFGAGDTTGETMVSFSPDVSVEDSRSPQCVSRDTLSAAGGIQGVVCLCPPGDNRRVLIMVLGSNMIRWPDDVMGNFHISGLAKGTYRVRFLPIDPAYPVLDTAFTVQQGKVTNVGTIYIGKPATLKENQDAYINLKFGMFIHFTMSTFDRCCCDDCYSVSGEWGKPASATVTPELFQPSKLDCGQWADVAKSAGCKYMVLTSKHHDGWCNWDSKLTEFDVGKSSWGAGKRDVIKEYADSARARGLKVGLFYSIWDKTNGHSLDFIKGQLTELLTNYGEITCLWFDGWKWIVGYNNVPYDTISNLIKSLQPNCLIIENNHYKTMNNTEIVEFEIPIDGPPNQGSIVPQEACMTIRTDQLWFWHPYAECNLMPAQRIFDELNLVNSRNANYLLDVTPDSSGLIPECVADRMAEVGKLNGVVR